MRESKFTYITLLDSCTRKPLEDNNQFGVITFGLCDVCGNPATHVVRDCGVVIGAGCNLHAYPSSKIVAPIAKFHTQ